MQALVNEPVLSYNQSATADLGTIFSLKQNSSIYLSKQVEFSDKVAELIQKLNRIRLLQQNWDSYGAEAPSAIAIENAQSFLIENHNLSLPFYFLAPGLNGELMIEFKQGNRAAELYFLHNGKDELILFENDEVLFEGMLNENFQKLLIFFNS